MSDAPKIWDVFICHASEDKKDFVRPLASILQQEGVKVWYDEFEIGVGDSISSKIETGLANSQIGVVVLSSAFLAKGWPVYELNTLKHLRIGGSTRLIPIFHEIDFSELRKSMPGLLDLKGLNSKDSTIAECAYQIVAAARPDLDARIHMRRVYQRIESQGRIEKVPLYKIAHGVKRRDKLPERDVSRLSVLQSCFVDVFDDGLEGWIQDFFCDVNYEREIRVWERMASCYLRCLMGHQYSKSIKMAVFQLLLGYFSGADDAEVARGLAKLPKGVRNRCADAIKNWLADWNRAQAHMLDNELVDNVEVQNLIDRMQELQRPVS